MKVLSLFDGMSCGRIALDQLGIPVEKYYASEVDKYAMQVSAANYPDIIQVGDICDLDPKDYKDVDLMLAGSPCQGFSFAGKQLAFDDPRSALFFEFIRLLKAIKPKYFLLENVRMKKEFLQVISEQVSACYPEIVFGIEPIFINSSLLSAQSRQRYYWTNIPNIKQPEDRGIVLRDILEDSFDSERDKAHCIDANYYKGASVEQYKKKHRRQLVNKPKMVGRDNTAGHDILKRVYSEDGKSPTITAHAGKGTVPKVETKPKKAYDIPREILKDNERQRRVYDPSGKSPTILGRSDSPKITTPKQVGVAVDIKGHDQIKRVYSPDGKSPTVTTCGGGHREPKVVTGGRIVGRAYDKDGKRMDKDGVSVANKTTQMLELRKDNKTNAITTVAKDSVVVEKLPAKSKVLKANYYKSSRANFENDTKKGGKFSATGVPLKSKMRKDSVAVEKSNNLEFSHGLEQGRRIDDGKKLSRNYSEGYRVYKTNGKSATITAQSKGGHGGHAGLYGDELHWRKLTPLECERLQTVPDNYTDHVSNTQRYKMLGNGWTVAVIKHIFQNMERE
jgi:DNA-cytosine methyltransferase